MWPNKIPILMLVGLLFLVNTCKAEVYTALVEMEGLLHTEEELIDTLDKYIHQEEDKLRKMRQYLEDYERVHREASVNIQQYLANPINAYLLVKRLTTDWKEVETEMMNNVGQAVVDNVTRFREVLKFPSDEDLNGAAVALMRLQDTYKLETSSLARGELNGVRYSKELSANDCFELGRQSYNNADYYHTVLWMTEALQRWEEESNKTVARSEIIEYLAFSTYMQGNVQRALLLTNELLELVPNHQRALGNKKYYEESLTKAGGAAKRGEDEMGENTDPSLTVSESKGPPSDLPERDMYEMLCRGETAIPQEIQKKLKCRYVDNGSPYLKIGKVKQEELFFRPKIVLYHNIIHDNEMEIVKKLAQPRFKRATVQNYKTGELETANYRISKSAWLKSEEDAHIERVCRRVEEVTGLSVETAEELQVVNYGIGGHYEPHFDFARREERNAFKSLGTGNRIATFLFYMSDVEQGGATVFPSIGVTLWPQKGSAAFWHNLHPNGEGDYLTRHAACPVLTGSKWVSNKWLHERGQEFRRPCALNQDAE